jgi:5-methylcytosine-specific restriction protein A
MIAKIADLPSPVTAAKADWGVASTWIGFTPVGDGPNATAQCQSTILSQAAGGYILEYVTQSFPTPNKQYLTDPTYLKDRAEHASVAGRLIAVHRLRHSARPLKEIVGDADYERIQDMWDENGRRRRWSVAFPIVETYEITSRPLASDIFSVAMIKHIFAHPSATLRPLNDEERQAIASLPLVFRPAANAWIAIEDDIKKAELSHIEKNIKAAIDKDLGDSACEGMTEEQWKKTRLRAAWLAQRFIRKRQEEKKIYCDECNFDPADRIGNSGIKPRSLLDVHHIRPLEEGKRLTTTDDFKLLCPTCHRIEHALLRLQKSK